jgi:hypothetical protein
MPLEAGDVAAQSVQQLGPLYRAEVRHHSHMPQHPAVPQPEQERRHRRTPRLEPDPADHAIRRLDRLDLDHHPPAGLVAQRSVLDHDAVHSPTAGVSEPPLSDGPISSERRESDHRRTVGEKIFEAPPPDGKGVLA